MIGKTGSDSTLTVNQGKHLNRRDKLGLHSGYSQCCCVLSEYFSDLRDFSLDVYPGGYTPYNGLYGEEVPFSGFRYIKV